MDFWAVPPPGAVIEEPMGAVIEPGGEAGAGCVVEPIAGGAADVLPQAVGCVLVVSDPPELEPESLDPGSDPVVAAVDCAWPGRPAGAALAEGGGTVRSLWQ